MTVFVVTKTRVWCGRIFTSIEGIFLTEEKAKEVRDGLCVLNGESIEIHEEDIVGIE